MRVRVTLRVRVSACASNVASKCVCVSRCEYVSIYLYGKNYFNNFNINTYNKTFIDDTCSKVN